MPATADRSSGGSARIWATQSELSRALGITRQTVGKMLKRRVIDGAAVTGEGRDTRIDVEMAKRQIRARRSVGQATSNGTRTKLTPARSQPPAPVADLDEDSAPDPGTALDQAIKREKLVEIQGRNRKAAEDEAARLGRYVLAVDHRAQAARLVAEMLRVFEGALPELAGAVAARHQSEARDELHALRQVFTRYRARVAEAARKAAAGLPRTVAEEPGDPASSPEE